MRRHTIIAMGLATAACAALPTQPVPAQSQASSHQEPTRQQIEQFCARWGRMSEDERRQYENQYQRYCQRPSLQPETTIMQPAEPLEPQQEPPRQQPGKPQQPDEPASRPAPTPDPELEPARPEPVIPEPAPARVDLAGRLALAGPPAREPGDRQRLRVRVENRGPDAPQGDRLWARVFLSDRDVSRRSPPAGAFSFSGRGHGQQVPVPGIPGPGQTREVMTEVPLPPTIADGNYWWCVQVDARRAIEETDESNNIACAREVVALGGETNSELSDLFGSRVNELADRTDVEEQARVDVTEPPADADDLLSHTRGSPCGEAAKIRVTSPAGENDDQDRVIVITDETDTQYAHCGIGVDMDIVTETDSLEPGTYRVFGGGATWPDTGPLDHTIYVETECGSVTLTVPTDRDQCRNLMATVTIPDGEISVEEGQLVGGSKCWDGDTPPVYNKNCIEGGL